MGWRGWKEGGEWDGLGTELKLAQEGPPKPRRGQVPPGPMVSPSPSTWGARLPAGSQHPSHSRFPYLVLRSSDPVWFPRSCHGDEM